MYSFYDEQPDMASLWGPGPAAHLMPSPHPPLSLRGVPPGFAVPSATSPRAGKPPILDRILARLFPINPIYGQFMTEDQRRRLPREGLGRFGLGLMQAGAPRPAGTSNVLSRLAEAIQGVQYGPAQKEAATESMQANEYATGLQAKQMRNVILNRYPATPNETVQETGARLLRMLPEFIRIGDMEMVGKLSEVLKSMNLGQNATVKNPMQIDTGNEVLLRDPVSGAITERYPKSITPGAQASNAISQGQQTVTNENAILDDYYRQTKDIQDAYWTVNQSLQNVPLARSGDGSAQVELLYAFVKALDPTSVVREGEVALAQSAASLFQQAQGLIAKFAQGQAVVVPPAVVDKMATLLRKRLGGYERRWKKIHGLFVSRAQRARVSPEGLLEPPSDYQAEPVVPPAPGGGIGIDRLPPRPR